MPTDTRAHIPYHFKEHPKEFKTQVKKAMSHPLTAISSDPFNSTSFFYKPPNLKPRGIQFFVCPWLLTLSFDVPITTLDSLFSKRSSVFKLPAAPGSGGKLDKPNSKLGDGGFGGGGDCVWPLWNRNNTLRLLHRMTEKNMEF